MARRDSSRGDPESGAVAVEFALVLPLLLLLVFGIIDFGRAWNLQVTLTQASREGVRGLALGVPGWDATAKTQAAAVGASGVTVTPTACPASPQPTDNASVTASVNYTFIPWFGGAIGNATTFPIQGKAVMRCGG